MKKTISIFTLVLLFFAAQAQDKPQPSPAASVSTTIGLTKVSVDYSRPQMKGRKIFGEGKDFLVPFGAIWRTGANSGTKISFSTDVTVEGVKVPKGDYLIFTWPGASEWTVTFYKDLSIGGYADKYDKTQEAANFKVKSAKTEMTDAFTVSITDIAKDSMSGSVKLAWETTSVKFKVEVPKTW